MVNLNAKEFSRWNKWDRLCFKEINEMELGLKEGKMKCDQWNW